MDGAERGAVVIGPIAFAGGVLLLAPVVCGWFESMGPPFSLRFMRVMERPASLAYGAIVGGVLSFSAPTLSVETLEAWWPVVASVPLFVVAQIIVRKIAEKAVSGSSGEPGLAARAWAWLTGADIPDEETLRLRASVPSAEEQLEASDAAIMAAQGLSEPGNAGEGDLAIVEGGDR